MAAITSATRLRMTPIRAKKKIPAKADRVAPNPSKPSSARNTNKAPRLPRMATTRPTTLASRLSLTGGFLANGGLTSVSSAAIFPPSELFAVMVKRRALTVQCQKGPTSEIEDRHCVLSLEAGRNQRSVAGPGVALDAQQRGRCIVRQ